MKTTEEISYSERELFPQYLESYREEKDFLELSGTSGLKLRIYYISQHILRFRYAIEGHFEPDFSYAICEDHKFEIPKVKLLVEEEYLSLSTDAIECRIYKENFRLKIFDSNGNLISEEEKGFHWEKNERYGGQIVFATKKIHKDEVFYGLGDKPSHLNLRGKRYQNWGTDEYGYEKDTDPLYKNIPFFYGLRNGIGYGIFMDNSFASYFDFAQERKNVMSFWAQGGEMNYYFIAGPELVEVCKRYTLLTGTPDMPPRWALGYQQCKWSYYPESQVREIAEKMRALEIPCDAIYLDIDYMDGFRCFTWDNEKFPNPKEMVSDLAKDGFKTMVIIDPGIKKDKDYPIFNEALEKGYFCRHIDGPYVEGKVWPGECYFPDFTKPEVRDWWADLYEELIAEIGVAGVWNDMNEPAIFEVKSKTFPLNVVHDFDGHPTSHRKAHNVYGMQMARASYDGVKKYSKGKRSLIITRSGYAGMQRYSSVWTGDNMANWEHLWIADVQAQRLAISGVSFCGSDIGGFIGLPTAELMIRWIQLGIFHPFCRVHSSGDHGDQEPWSFGEECTILFRRYVELRYQLLPYLYTAFYRYHKEGLAMLLPLVFVDQENKETTHKDHEFLCGEQILICPVFTEGKIKRKVYLPKGDWVNYWTDEKMEGRTMYEVDCPLERIPMFIKAGAIIPKFPVQQYVGQKQFDHAFLHAYYKLGEETSYLYEDDGDSYDYEKGVYNYHKFILEGSENKLTISKDSKGHYTSGWTHFKMILHSLPFDLSKVVVDGKELKIDGDELEIPIHFRQVEIT